MAIHTRRDLLRNSLLLGGTLCAPHIWAATGTVRNYAAGHQILLVRGGTAGIASLISTRMAPTTLTAAPAPPKVPAMTVAPAVAARLQSMAIAPPETNTVQFALGWNMSPPVVDWLTGAVNHVISSQDGSVVTMDYDYKVTQTLDWTAGSIAQVIWPGCAAASHDTPNPVITVQAATLRYRPGDHRPMPGYSPPGKTAGKAWLRANYRVTSNTNIDLTTVASVSDLLFVPTSYGGAVTLSLGFGRERPDLLGPFTAALQAGGALVPGQSTDITIQYLDPGLVNALASVTLHNCRVISVGPGSLGLVPNTAVAINYADASLSILPAPV